MERHDVYQRTFDEDVPTQSRTDAACPACGGTVTTSAVETACIDCRLVIHEERPDNGAGEHSPDARSS